MAFGSFQWKKLDYLIIMLTDGLVQKETGHRMMASSNGNIFSVTGTLCGEFTGHRWIPPTKASDTELWCFLSSAPE